MSYQHYQAIVEKAKKYHAAQVRDNLETGFDRLGTLPSDVVVFDGCVVHEKVKEFMDALAPLGYKFVVSDECRARYLGHGVYSYLEVCVYREGDEYSMGRIGFSDVARKRSTIMDRYTVYSRTIESRSNSSWHQNIKHSEKLDTAVKLAKKYLRIYSPTEVCKASVSNFIQYHRKLTDVHTKARDVVFNEIAPSTREAVEIMIALAVGKTPTLPVHTIEKIHQYEQLRVKAEEELNRKRPAYHVAIRGVEGQQYVDTIAFDHISPLTIGAVGWEEQVKNVVTVSADDIPEDIMGRISVLSMNPDGHYVAGVGYKVSDRVYWIDREGL
jgi:hypothetical protein